MSNNLKVVIKARKNKFFPWHLMKTTSFCLKTKAASFGPYQFMENFEKEILILTFPSQCDPVSFHVERG